jgi:hypothetical protein
MVASRHVINGVRLPGAAATTEELDHYRRFVLTLANKVAAVWGREAERELRRDSGHPGDRSALGTTAS